MIKIEVLIAKAKVEFCNDSENGVILYAYADKLLSEYSCKLYQLWLEVVQIAEPVRVQEVI